MRIRIVTWLALLALAPLGASAAARPAAQRVKATVPLTIVTAHGMRRFDVEVARTPAEQERGLMFRRALPSHGGMIFPMDPPRPANFWMKNTRIPLDIIFIRSGGTIVRIANAVPFSLDMIESGEPVAAVLEIAGGRTQALGIRPGDRVAWSRR